MSKVEVKETPPEPPAEERNWAELHRDVLVVIFCKIGLHEVLLRTRKVCSSWRKVARDDPLLWRRIDMGMKHDDSPIYHEFNRIQATVKFNTALANMMKIAVNWGGNNVQQLSIGKFCDENLLEYITERTRNLKNISIECNEFHERMAKALGRLKQLEELEIVWHYAPSGLMMRAIGTECPQLKRLKLKSPFHYKMYSHVMLSTKLGIPQTMLQLKYLQLTVSCITTTNKEVMKILERCPNLESLDLHGSIFITVKDDDIRGRCPRIHTLLLPDGDINDSIYDEIYDDIHEFEGADDTYANIYSDTDTDDDIYDDLYVDTYDYLYDSL